MRMWMVDPREMCQAHLLGEHREMHALVGMLSRKKKIQGYIDNKLLQPRLIKQRHDELVEEMLRRGMNHHTILIFDESLLEYLPVEHKNAIVDPIESKKELIRRCVRCRDHQKNT